MLKLISIGVAVAGTIAVPAAASKLNDRQVAHIAYTAGDIDIAAGRQALAKSHDRQVRNFAGEMIRDHRAVNVKDLAIVRKLRIEPQPNATSASLSKTARATQVRLGHLAGRAFDRAYIANEVAYHKAALGLLSSTLIPASHDPKLKALLEGGLSLFGEHLAQAEQLQAKLK